MASIQLALTDTGLANALRNMLMRNTDVPVKCVESPECGDCCVLVVDPPHFRSLPVPLAYPERVVLIARDDPSTLRNAWDAGVNSVVSERDPINTVMLAILSACLRMASTSRPPAPEKERRTGPPVRKQ
jgi:hypothetical protein